ncbi:hypothetical protein HZS_2057 [Henneguya salminicola]|nr:hypothetical protein HZS_2057 [Henneguya salminicola]
MSHTSGIVCCRCDGNERKDFKREVLNEILNEIKSKTYFIYFEINSIKLIKDKNARGFKIRTKIVEARTDITQHQHTSVALDIKETSDTKLCYILILNDLNCDLVVEYIEIYSTMADSRYTVKNNVIQFARFVPLGIGSKRKVDLNYRLYHLECASYYFEYDVDDEILNPNSNILNDVHIENHFIEAMNLDYNPPNNIKRVGSIYRSSLLSSNPKYKDIFYDSILKKNESMLFKHSLQENMTTKNKIALPFKSRRNRAFSTMGISPQHIKKLLE